MIFERFFSGVDELLCEVAGVDEFFLLGIFGSMIFRFFLHTFNVGF